MTCPCDGSLSRTLQIGKVKDRNLPGKKIVKIYDFCGLLFNHSIDMSAKGKTMACLRQPSFTKFYVTICAGRGFNNDDARPRTAARLLA